MAFSSRELLLILRARDEASRVVRGLGNEFASVDAAAQKAARNQMSAGSALMSIGVGMGAVGGAALAWMKGSIDMAVEFNNTIAKTSTQLDDVAGSQKDLANVIKRTAKDIAVPIEQMQEGLFDIFSSMDVTVPQAESLLRSFSKEAVAGQVDLREASRSTIGILNAFHLKVEEVTRVQDVQFQLVRKGVGTYEEFAKVMGRATPSAARAGQSVETLAGMLAYLTRNGMSAAMASASAGRAFDAFAHPAVVNRLTKMGVKVKDAEGNFRSMGSVMKDLQVELGEMTAPERAEALQQLFKGAGGTIQARRFYDMVLKDKESVDQFITLVGDMENAQGAFSNAYQTMSDTTASRTQVLKNNWELLRIEVGQALVPVLEKLVEWLSIALQWWNSLSEGTKKQIMIWTAVGAAIMVVLGVITFIAGAFLMLAGAAAMAGIGLGALLGIFVLIIAGVAAIVVGIILLVKHWDTVTKALGDAWNWLWGILKPIIDWIWNEIGGKLTALWKRVSGDLIAGVKAVGEWFNRIWTQLVTWTKSAWDGIKDVIMPFVDWFVGVWPFIENILQNFIQFILDSFSAVWTVIVGIFKGAWIAISGVIEGIILVFQGVIDFIVGVLTLNWTQAWNGIKAIFEGIWTIIKGVVLGVWEAIKGIFFGAMEFIGSLLANGWQAILNLLRIALDGIGRLWNQFWNWVGEIFSGIGQWLVNIATDIKDKLGEAFEVAVEYIRQQWEKIKNFLKGPVNFVIEFIYNKGIRWLWNKVANFVGLGELPEMAKLADGGHVRGPGGPRDDKIPAMLSDGEYVMPADKTSRYYPMLQAMRAGTFNGLPGFALGGLVGKVVDWVGDATSDVINTFSDPVKWVMDAIGNSSQSVRQVARIPIVTAGKIGKSLWDAITKWELEEGDPAHELMEFFGQWGEAGNNSSGPGGLVISLLKRFAHAQEGKTYLWGATGPKNWDCSGLVGGLWALTQGKDPYKRYMTTSTMGVGKFGLKKGAGRFTVFLGPGHTAANIGGLHAEAYGGNGTPLAIGHVGTPLSYYNQIMHFFADGGLATLKNNKQMRLQSFLSRGWPEPGMFDQGGWLKPGWNFNGLSTPEPVLSPEQYETLLRIADGRGGSGEPIQQTFNITTQEIDPRKHAADLGWEMHFGRVV